MADQDAPAVAKVGGQEGTSYTSPGASEVGDTLARPTAPKEQKHEIDNASFINAALTLSDHMGLGSYDEAATALLVAKASNPDYDLGVLSGLSGRASAVHETLVKNADMIAEAQEQSFETRIRRLVAALTSVREQFDDKDGFVVPVATLKNHAIVVNSKGDLFRAHYEESDADIKILKAEKFATTEATTAHKVESKSGVALVKGIVNDLFEGRKDRVQVGLKDLLQTNPTETREEFDRNRHQHLLQQIKNESFWKNHVRANAHKMKAFVRGALSEINNTSVKPKYGKLRAREVDAKFESQYAKDVRKSLAGLMEKFEKVRAEVSETFTRDQWLINSLSSYDRKHGVQTANFLNTFVADYVNTLTTVSEGLRLAVVESSLPFQAHLYDTLAEEYPTYVLGYLFIKKALSDIRTGV
jgi:hypothetical protein